MVLSEIWELAGHGSATDVHCGSKVGRCLFDGSVCKHVDSDASVGDCWIVFSSGRVRVCSHLDVLRVCEMLARCLRSKGASQ